MKKKRETKLSLYAERIRELTIEQLPAVNGGDNNGAGGGGSTESARCPPPPPPKIVF